MGVGLSVLTLYKADCVLEFAGRWARMPWRGIRSQQVGDSRGMGRPSGISKMFNPKKQEHLRRNAIPNKGPPKLAYAYLDDIV